MYWTGNNPSESETSYVQVRPAIPDDWPVIEYRQKLNARDLWGTVKYPGLYDAIWLVAENQFGISAALGIKLSESGAQLCLLWDKGLQSAKGTLALMRHLTNALPKEMPIWYWTFTDLDAGVKKAFNRWDFYPTETVDKFTKYERRIP